MDENPLGTLHLGSHERRSCATHRPTGRGSSNRVVPTRVLPSLAPRLSTHGVQASLNAHDLISSSAVAPTVGHYSAGVRSRTALVTADVAPTQVVQVEIRRGGEQTTVHLVQVQVRGECPPAVAL